METDEIKKPIRCNEPPLGFVIGMIVFFGLCCFGLLGVLYLTTQSNPQAKPLSTAVGDEREKCSTNTCNNHGECYDKYPIGFICVCDAGYSGSSCEVDVDDCESLPCIHGICTDLPNDFQCSCEAGYSGKNCQLDDDECLSTPSPCSGKGDCHDQVNGYLCLCQDGYTGNTCEIEINECDTDPCIHGTCTDLVNDFQCSCEAGYTDKTCSTDLDNCADPTGNGSSLCLHGVCLDLVDSYICQCDEGWLGDDCSVRFLPCSADRTTKTCQNDGTCTPCIDPAVCANNFICTCLPDITGELCDVLVPVDGVWSPWIDEPQVHDIIYTAAEGSCEGDQTTSTRVCTPPINGGADCQGDPQQVVTENEVCTCTACADVTLTGATKTCSCDSQNCVANGDCCDIVEDVLNCPPSN